MLGSVATEDRQVLWCIDLPWYSSCLSHIAWMRSLSWSLGVCLSKAVFARAFLALEFFSPRLNNRRSSSVSIRSGLIATGLEETFSG